MAITDWLPIDEEPIRRASVHFEKGKSAKGWQEQQTVSPRVGFVCRRRRRCCAVVFTGIVVLEAVGAVLVVVHLEGVGAVGVLVVLDQAAEEDDEGDLQRDQVRNVASVRHEVLQRHAVSTVLPVWRPLTGRPSRRSSFYIEIPQTRNKNKNEKKTDPADRRRSISGPPSSVWQRRNVPQHTRTVSLKEAHRLQKEQKQKETKKRSIDRAFIGHPFWRAFTEFYRVFFCVTNQPTDHSSLSLLRYKKKQTKYVLGLELVAFITGFILVIFSSFQRCIRSGNRLTIAALERTRSSLVFFFFCVSEKRQLKSAMSCHRPRSSFFFCRFRVFFLLLLTQKNRRRLQLSQNASKRLRPSKQICPNNLSIDMSNETNGVASKKIKTKQKTNKRTSDSLTIVTGLWSRSPVCVCVLFGCFLRRK